MKSHIVATHQPIPEGIGCVAACGTKIYKSTFGAMGDLRSFRELQDAVSCWKCKKAHDPARKFYYGVSEAQEAMEQSGL